MAIEIGRVQKMTSPNPFALLSTRKPDGGTNLMAVSWWTYASNHPATIVACLSKRGYSGELIEKNGEFVLNIVNETLKEAAFACGTCSGRDTDKAEKFGIQLADSEVIDTKQVSEIAASMECRLLQAVDVGDHSCYVAEVVATRIRLDARPIFAWDGYRRLDVAEGG